MSPLEGLERGGHALSRHRQGAQDGEELCQDLGQPRQNMDSVAVHLCLKYCTKFAKFIINFLFEFIIANI